MKNKLNQPFRCRNCGQMVFPDNAGTSHRNHCPLCLCSQHLDRAPGDRKESCGSIMEPIAIWVRKGGEWAIIHRCRGCGAIRSNRIAADDNPAMLISIAARAIANPPFPLEYVNSGHPMILGSGQANNEE